MLTEGRATVSGPGLINLDVPVTAASGVGASATGQIPGQSERLWSPSTWGELQDQLDGVVQADSPSRVHHDRSGTATRTDPASDHVVADPYRTGGAGAVGRPGTLADERPVGDADRREIESGTQMYGETGSAWVIGPGGVDEQRLGFDGQAAHRCFEEAADAQGQQARDVGRGGRTEQQALIQRLALANHHGGGPGRIPCAARPGESAREAHPASADRQRPGRTRPRLGRPSRQLVLLGDQSVGVTGPHRPCCPPRVNESAPRLA